MGRLAMDGEAGAPSSDPDSPIRGRRIPLNMEGLPPNIVPKGAQLISSREDIARQWVITLAPVTTVGQPTLPWQSTQRNGTSGPDFDGGLVAPPGNPPTFTAPALPMAAALSSGQQPGLQATLRWGAGGVAWETAFDYPAAGGVFGITADAVDLNVALKVLRGAYAVFATAGEVPVVGAFMVPGQAASPTPLRWVEDSQAIAFGTSRFWAVKPFARTLLLSETSSTAFTKPIRVNWVDKNNNSVWTDEINQAASAVGFRHMLDVPPGAVAIEVANTDPAVNAVMWLQWFIGLV